jgi:hypothetical protein
MTIFKSSTKPRELEAKKVAEQAMKSQMPQGAKPNVGSKLGGNVKAGYHHK